MNNEPPTRAITKEAQADVLSRINTIWLIARSNINQKWTHRDAERVRVHVKEIRRMLKTAPTPAPTRQEFVTITRERPACDGNPMRHRLVRTRDHEQAAATRARRAGCRIVEDVRRIDLLLRDGDHCYLCGLWMSWKDASFDHVIPTSKGGQHTRANLRLTHRLCNSRKGDKLPEELAA